MLRDGADRPLIEIKPGVEESVDCAAAGAICRGPGPRRRAIAGDHRDGRSRWVVRRGHRPRTAPRLLHCVIRGYTARLLPNRLTRVNVAELPPR